MSQDKNRLDDFGGGRQEKPGGRRERGFKCRSITAGVAKKDAHVGTEQNDIALAPTKRNLTGRGVSMPQYHSRRGKKDAHVGTERNEIALAPMHTNKAR